MNRWTKLAALIGSLALAGCNSGADGGSTPDDASDKIDTVESATADPEPTQRCADLIDADAIAAFGWRPGEPAGESAGRCERSGGGNVVIVGQRRDLDASQEADRAKRAYDRACAAMATESGGVLDTATTWLGSAQACLKEFTAGKQTGVARMFVLTEDATIVEVQVVAHDATTRTQLRRGLTALVEGVEVGW